MDRITSAPSNFATEIKLIYNTTLAEKGRVFFSLSSVEMHDTRALLHFYAKISKGSRKSLAKQRLSCYGAQEKKNAGT